ncbi:MAG: murein L,D-transpeptidase [Parvibaculaceae bacterium]
MRSRFLLAAAVLAADMTGVAFAQSDEDYTSSISALTRQAPSGKLATQTEILAGETQAAMLTPASQEAMSAAIGMYEDIVARGGWPMVSGKKLEKGARSDDVITLRQRLIAEGYLPFESLAEEKPSKFTSDVAEAVKAFQANHGLAQTGKIDARTQAELNVPAERRLDQLRVNEPRVAAYLQDLGGRYILVNIPSAQLEAVNFGAVYSRHNIIAGKIDRPSPALMSRISDINFNPYWNAPDSIARRDLIPKLMKNPNALSEMRIRVLDRQTGEEIDPHQIDWSVTPSEPYLFRQDPGNNNSLGTVKINFPNKFAVYLHDTPAKQLFGQNARFESSGCIRVDRIEVLIDWIFSGQDGVDPMMIEDIAASGERLDKPVRNGPDLRIMYLTAWATEDGRIHFRPDIYGLDGTGFVLGQPEPRGAL